MIFYFTIEFRYIMSGFESRGFSILRFWKNEAINEIESVLSARGNALG
jgi:very-short-patch-repair endonuclease